MHLHEVQPVSENTTDSEIFTNDPYQSLLNSRDVDHLFRDPRFIEEESKLDEIMLSGQPEQAIEVEQNLIQEVNSLEKIPEGLARITLKAIAIAQSARQLYMLNGDSKDTAYANIGNLMYKLRLEQDYLKQRSDRNVYNNEIQQITGTMSELCFYALAAYDSNLERPLSHREQGASARYILPSTLYEDFGEPRFSHVTHSSVKNGVDFNITYLNGDRPNRSIQVKTSDLHQENNIYNPSIVVVPMNGLGLGDRVKPNIIFRSIIKDALGDGDMVSDRIIDTATERLNNFIK